MRSTENRPTVPIRRRERRGPWVGLSFALHLAVLLLLLFRLPEQVTPPAPIPEGRGSPASVAMITDAGTAEGVKLPTPSFAPATVAPADAPSAAPPPPMPPPAPAETITAETAPPTPPPVPAPPVAIPTPAPVPTPSPATLPATISEAQADASPTPASTAAPPSPPPPAPAPPSRAAPLPAPRPAPQVITRNTLPEPPSRTLKQPNRTADNHGARENAPGPEALNSEGAPPHVTNGPDPTTSTGGAAGEDGQPPRARRRGFERVVNSLCSGVITVGQNAFQGTGERAPALQSGQVVPIQAHFFLKDDGTAWIRWTYYSRRPIDLPVAIQGAEITWAGEFGAVNTVNAAAGDHLRGTVFLAHTPSTIDLACVGSDTHPFSGHL